MTKMWSTKKLLGKDKREVLVWNHMLSHCYFKYLGLSKGGIIPRKLIKIRKIPPCVVCIFVKSHNIPWRTKGKHSGGSIRKTLENRPGAIV